MMDDFSARQPTNYDARVEALKLAVAHWPHGEPSQVLLKTADDFYFWITDG